MCCSWKETRVQEVHKSDDSLELQVSSIEPEFENV
jgi:hypothetical protein